MRREINKLLTDIDRSIGMIETYLSHVPTLNTFKSDFLVINPVHRRLATIGEALWKADKLDEDMPITDKKRIISLRHILVHDYDVVDDNAIWTICNKHIPTLKQEVEAILNNQKL